MLLQPFAPVMARQVIDEYGRETAPSSSTGSNYNSAEIEEARAEFDTAYEQITGMQAIDVSNMSWTLTIADLFIPGDLKAEIAAANEMLEDAKAQMEEAKTQMDSGDVEAAMNADPSKVAGDTMEAQSQAMSDIRQGLTNAGNTLVAVGGVVETVCNTLSSIITKISDALNSISIWLPLVGTIYVGSFLSYPFDELNLGVQLLGDTFGVIRAAGESLIATAEAGQYDDATLLGNLDADTQDERDKLTDDFKNNMKKIYDDFLGIRRNNENGTGDADGEEDPTTLTENPDENTEDTADTTPDATPTYSGSYTGSYTGGTSPGSWSSPSVTTVGLNVSDDGSTDDTATASEGLTPEEFDKEFAEMKTPTKDEILEAAKALGLSEADVKIIVGTTQREGYVGEPYLSYGWASVMINNPVSIEDMQKWDPGKTGDDNYYSQANIDKGYEDASDEVLKAVYLAITKRNTKMVECDGMYEPFGTLKVPSTYKEVYRSTKYKCAIYERNSDDIG